MSGRSLANPAVATVCRLQFSRLLDRDTYERRMREHAMSVLDTWKRVMTLRGMLAWQQETSVTATPPDVSTLVGSDVRQTKLR